MHCEQDSYYIVLLLVGFVGGGRTPALAIRSTPRLQNARAGTWQGHEGLIQRQ